MTKPQDKLYITFHRVNEEGKSVGPSFLISKLLSYFKKLTITTYDEETDDMDYILQDEGIRYLSEGLRNSQTSEIFNELYYYYRNDQERRRILDLLIAGAFYVNKEKGISKEAAYLLYGDKLSGSVTRLERYAGCAFAHFMSYGLSLEQRKEYKLAVPDIGNIFHNAIDEFSKMLDVSRYNWHTIPDEIREEWAIEAVKAVDDFEGSYLEAVKEMST